MSGKLTSELEKVLQDLKDKRQEEKQELFLRISDSEQKIQELLSMIEELKKNHADVLDRLREDGNRQKSKFTNELGIANEKVRIVEDDNLKFQAGLEALKKQLDMEKSLRAEGKISFENKIESLSKNYENIITSKQKEITSLEKKMASLQERFLGEISRERSKSEAAVQLIKSELESVSGARDAEKVKFDAQRKDKEKTIEALKHETELLKAANKELYKKMRIREEDAELRLKNLDREWSEVLRKKEKELSENEARMKNLKKDITAQFEAKLNEMASDKKELSEKILETQRIMEEMALSHERRLVEKDEIYRNQIAKLREQQIDLQTQYQQKEDELNMIRSELENEISSISQTAFAAKTPPATAPLSDFGKKKKEAEGAPGRDEEKGIKGAIKGIFGKKKTPPPINRANSDLGLFINSAKEENESELPEKETFSPPKGASSRIEDEKARQINLILEQKKENINDLKKELQEETKEEKKNEIRNQIDALKVEIEKWQTRL